MRSLAWLWVAVVMASGGCAGSPKLHAFPGIWPPSLETARGSAAPAAGSQEPVVGVETFVLEAGEPAGPGARRTDEVLTALFVEKLRSSGVAVVPPEKAQYLFRAAIPQLGYTAQGGYPRKIAYFSKLSYQLIHQDTGIVVRDGSVGQDFEQTVLVNTMTRLPSDPGAPERVLLEKCVEPTWASVAADLGDFLKKQVS